MYILNKAIQTDFLKSLRHKIGWGLRMDKEMKSLLTRWGLGGAIAIILIPIAVNLLMIPKVGAIGQPNTWITFFGSYIGSILSGLLTLIGVLLTINYTVKQNAINQDFTYRENLEQLKFTRAENLRMLEENRKENRRNKLPEMIYHLEACLDFLEEKTEEVEKYNGENLIDTLRTRPHERPLKMFLVTENYTVEMQKHTRMITKLYLRKVRDFTVKADIPAYDAFLKFKENLTSAYAECISSISSDFFDFQFNIMENYFETHDHIIVDSNSDLNEIELIEEDQERLIELKRELYRQDTEYLNQVISAYWAFQETLEVQLHNLVQEYNNG